MEELIGNCTWPFT